MKIESVITDEGKVFSSCFETYVFPNQGGSITIKQRCWPDEDQMVSIPVHYVELMIKALRLAKADLLDK
jgi:hypothetical protein